MTKRAIALILLANRLILTVTAKCSERHVDSFYACVKANDDKHYAKLTDEFVASIERRSDKCFNADGQCKLKGRWNTAHDLCIGAKVCQCTFCDILFDIVSRVTTGDETNTREADVCIRRRTIENMYRVAESCVRKELGFDVLGILMKHVPERSVRGNKTSSALPHVYMLARSNVDRCMHFEQAEARARTSDQCWWHEADNTPVGLATCAIAMECATQASDADCGWVDLRKTLSSFCGCMKQSRRQTAGHLLDIVHAAVKLTAGGGGDKAGKTKACVDKVHEMDTVDGIVPHLATTDYAMSECVSDRPPFTAGEMVEAMCGIAADTGRTWKLRHGLAQGTNYFAMYSAEKVMRYCTCF